DLESDALLDLPKARLSAVGEEVGDARAGPPLDLRVEVDERPAEASRHLCAEAALARPHEPGEREVPVERVQARGRHRSPIRPRYASYAARTSTSESPPSLSSAARASSNATAASATTESASTA